MSRRLTVNLPKLVEEDLEWLADDTDENYTALVAKGIRLLRVYQEAVRNGGSLTRVSKNGADVEAIVIL